MQNTGENVDKLRLNTDFIGFEGIIGRRDYFINILYTAIISTLATIPVTWSLLSNMETMGDAFNYVKLFSGMPILLKLWYVLVSTVLLIYFYLKHCKTLKRYKRQSK